MTLSKKHSPARGSISRRTMLKKTGGAIGSLAVFPFAAFAADEQPSVFSGAIVGEPTAAKIGLQVLQSGGNAVDAIVTAALVAAVVSPQNCGIGGYGGHMTLALANKRKVTCIDFNSAAPAAATAGMFQSTEKGSARSNEHGWLASGVPGTLAGLDLALKKFGTRRLRDCLQPAIGFAREGFPAGPRLALAIKSVAPQVRQDPATARLLLPNGEPPLAADMFRNPKLAQLLEKLAARDSVDSFYRGDFAIEIANAFRNGGGLVTAQDLADYRAREIEPLKLKWGADQIYTAPLTAGGLTVIEALSILKAMKWEHLPDGPEKSHARLEALRVAWRDRLTLLGDPKHGSSPVNRLLSDRYATEMAQKIQQTIHDAKPLPLDFEMTPDLGTVNLSCVDRRGNLAALTLTHGNSFGAQVTVESLGLTLGHGMSRFDAKPGRPNSVGPGKRPLHNMCPSVILRDGHPVLALGGAGGRKIPNAVFDVLISYLTSGSSIEKAIAAPRMHTEGTLSLTLERSWPEETKKHLESIGYHVQAGAGALVSAASFDPATGRGLAVAR